MSYSIGLFGISRVWPIRYVVSEMLRYSHVLCSYVVSPFSEHHRYEPGLARRATNQKL